MSKKDKQDNPKIEENKKEEKKIEPFKYGIAPRLTVSIAREERVYRFEMPIGAKLVECEQACGECLNIVKKMKEEAEAKAEEEKAKKDNSEKESFKDV